MRDGSPLAVSDVLAALRSLIARRGTSVRALEREMGLPEAYLRNALTGAKRLSLDLLLEVLNHLGAGADEIFGRATPDPDEVAERLESYPPDDVARALARALVRKGVLSPEDLDPED